MFLEQTYNAGYKIKENSAPDGITLHFAVRTKYAKPVTEVSAQLKTMMAAITIVTNDSLVKRRKGRVRRKHCS